MTAGPAAHSTNWQRGKLKAAWLPFVRKWRAACTPRPSAEIPGGQGIDVWEGRAQVLTADGEDFSNAFLDGARQALALVQRHHIRIAILKANSPSCGNLLTYDGTFSGVKVSGEGVTAALLKRHGVQVFSELQLPEAAVALTQL